MRGVRHRLVNGDRPHSGLSRPACPGVVRPRSPTEVAEVVREAASSGSRLTLRGVGHSADAQTLPVPQKRGRDHLAAERRSRRACTRWTSTARRSAPLPGAGTAPSWTPTPLRSYTASQRQTRSPRKSQ